MLRKYFDDCHSKGVYLLIEEDSHYFTINFNKYDASDDCFPPHDKEIVSPIIVTKIHPS